MNKDTINGDKAQIRIYLTTVVVLQLVPLDPAWSYQILVVCPVLIVSILAITER